MVINPSEGMSPSEKFELTANSLGAHIETHRKLILRTLTYLTMNSQDDSVTSQLTHKKAHSVRLL